MKTLEKEKRLNSLFQKGKEFIHSIDASDKIVIVHHADGDGYCSGVLLYKLLERLGVSKNITTFPAINEDLEELIKKNAEDYNRIIILDIDVPYLEDYFKKFKGEILIIDHHSIRKDLNSENVTYVNPRFDNEEIYQPASFVIYKFASSFINIEDLKWISVLGTVSDFGFEDCKEILSGEVNAGTKDGLVETEWWKVSNMIYGAIIVNPGIVFDSLKKSSGLEEIKNDVEISKAYTAFELEYEKLNEEFMDNLEEDGAMFISRVSPRHKRIASMLSTNFSMKEKDKPVFVLERTGEHYKISARLQSGRIHLGKLMETCCISGGGHRAAAGGIILASDYEKFKQCVKSKII